MKKLLKVVAVAAVMAISANSAFAQFGIEARKSVSSPIHPSRSAPKVRLWVQLDSPGEP